MGIQGTGNSETIHNIELIEVTQINMECEYINQNLNLLKASAIFRTIIVIIPRIRSELGGYVITK